MRIKGKGILFSVAVLACWQSIFCGLENDSTLKTRGEITAFLIRFQEGYDKRDQSKVREWTRELMAEDVCVIGTNGVFPNSGEWQSGIDKAEELFANDWKRWGVVKTNVDNSDIMIVTPDVAIVSMTATVTKSPENGFGRSNDENMERCMSRLVELEKDAMKPARQKLITAIWDAGVVLKNAELGDTFVWPIRISMVLVKRDGSWKMAQTHYSYPMAGYPPVRLVDGKVTSQ